LLTPERAHPPPRGADTAGGDPATWPNWRYQSVPVRLPARRGCLILSPGGGRLTQMVLSERERAILDFERTWWTEPGPKEVAIKERFDLSSGRSYKLLNTLIEPHDALDYAP